MTSTSKSKPDAKAENACAFCLTRNVDELNLGKFQSKGNINVHYFCMLLSSGLSQNGDDDEGILGFLLKDIQCEIRRGQKLRCCYCKHNGATIGCAEKRCQKKFHLPCAVVERSLHQFTDKFPSYCENHKPVQRVTLQDQRIFLAAKNDVCAICLFPIENLCKHTTLRAPCCKNAWFHRQCLQQLAVNAGYFFRCPLCNNNKDFQKEMLIHGIYIPEQDASWEMETGAFQDLLYRHNNCDVECSCPNGSEFNEDGSRWEIILCKSCGSQGCHVKCGNINWIKREWECNNCLDVRKPVAMQQKAKEMVATAGIKRQTLMDTFVTLKKKRTDFFSSDDSDGDSDIDVINFDNNSPPTLPNQSEETAPTRLFPPEVVCITDSDADDDIFGSSKQKAKRILHSPKLKLKQDKMAEKSTKLFAINEEKFAFDKPVRIYESRRFPPQIEEMKSDEKLVQNSKTMNEFPRSLSSESSDDDERSEVHSEVDPGPYFGSDDEDNDSDDNDSDGEVNSQTWVNEMEIGEEPETEIWVPETDRRYEFYARTGATGVKIVILGCAE